MAGLAKISMDGVFMFDIKVYWDGSEIWDGR
jgi:hypothetical protein